MKPMIVVAALLTPLVAALSCAQKTKPIGVHAQEESKATSAWSTPDEMLDELVPGMGAENIVDREKPQKQFEDVCLHVARPGAEEERTALCRAIVKRLGPETPKPARVWMLRQLANVGSDECVPELAELLNDEDPQIRELSRRALQNNPARSAPPTLRAALDHAQDPAWQVALINALAARRDEDSLSRFVELAEADSPDVAAAAVAALGDIGATQELKRVRLRLPSESRGAATDALLRCAERHLNAGDKAKAYALYSHLHEAGASEAVRVASLHGMVRARGVRVVPLLLTLITGDDPHLAATAARFAEKISGRTATQLLLKPFNSAPPAAQALLLETYAARGDQTARGTVLAAVHSDDAQVRVAALQALQSLGDGSMVTLLAKAAADSAGEEREAARESLKRLRGDDVDETVLSVMQTETDAAVRCELIKALAARWYRPAIPALFQATEEPEGTVQAAAFEALGDLALESHLPALVRRLVDVKGDDPREVAESAVVDTSLRITDAAQRATPVLTLLDDTSGTAKASLIRVLGRIGGDRALQAIRAARQSDESEVVDAVVRALADWPDPDVIDDLLDITRASSSQTHRVLALRGYVRLVRLPSEREPLDTFKMLEEALSLVERPEEKKLVLSGLADVGHIKALQTAESYLDDEALRDEAAVAMLTIARALAAEQRDLTLATIEKVRAATSAEAVQQQAGEAAEFVQRFEGYSAAWLLSGPYLEEGKKSADLFDIVFPPEIPDAADVEWTPLAVNNHDNPWIFDLKQAIGGDSRCAYVRTFVWSDRERSATLEIGSDDGVKAWLNGELVHSNLAYRLVNAADDKVAVTLSQGWNALMLKIVQGGSAWGFCAGFRTPEGGTLEGLRFQAE